MAKDLIMVVALVLGIGGMGACIFPDTDIVVYSTQGCGEQFAASTNWAWGYSGNGDLKHITIDDEPITQKWCLTPEEAELMVFEDSWIHIQIREDIIDACFARALELELGQVNCAQMASVAYSGTCPGEQEWCMDESVDEVGTPP